MRRALFKTLLLRVDVLSETVQKPLEAYRHCATAKSGEKYNQCSPYNPAPIRHYVLALPILRLAAQAHFRLCRATAPHRYDKSDQILYPGVRERCQGQNL